MGHTPTASPAKIIRIAKAEVGYHEGRSNGHWNNHQKFSPAVPGLEWSQNQAWCATFVSWCAMKAGFASLFPRTASTDAGARWFKDRKRWSEYPAIGAQFYLGNGNDMYHTGLVYDFDDTYIYTIEGNTNSSGSAEGDGVYLKKRLRRSTAVRGYGYPAYAEGIVSADPAWAKHAPKAAPRKPIRKVKSKAKFKAATWNVYHGTPLTKVEGVLKRLDAKGVSIILLQEGQQKGLAELFAKYGYHSYKGGFECWIAWKPEVWDMLSKGTTQLSKRTYWRTNGSKVPYLKSPRIRFRLKGGRPLNALSYHTPSAVQRGGKVNHHVRHRVNVAEDAMTVLRDLAASRVYVLFGGDDNWDERLGHWGKFLKKFTGLQVVQAPSGTHGKRRIDDFRTKGLVALEAETIDGGGDHRVHIRTFQYVR